MKTPIFFAGLLEVFRAVSIVRLRFSTLNIPSDVEGRSVFLMSVLYVTDYRNEILCKQLGEVILLQETFHIQHFGVDILLSVSSIFDFYPSRIHHVVVCLKAVFEIAIHKDLSISEQILKCFMGKNLRQEPGIGVLVLQEFYCRVAQVQGLDGRISRIPIICDRQKIMAKRSKEESG